MLQISSKAILSEEFLGQRRNELIVSFDDQTAMLADEVNVWAVMCGGIKHAFGAYVNPARQPFLNQKVEGAVNCGDVHSSGTPLHILEYLLRGHVTSAAGYHLNDHLALGGDAVSSTAQGLEESVAVGHKYRSLMKVAATKTIIGYRKASSSSPQRINMLI